MSQVETRAYPRTMTYTDVVTGAEVPCASDPRSSLRPAQRHVRPLLVLMALGFAGALGYVGMNALQGPQAGAQANGSVTFALYAVVILMWAVVLFGRWKPRGKQSRPTDTRAMRARRAALPRPALLLLAVGAVSTTALIAKGLTLELASGIAPSETSQYAALAVSAALAVVAGYCDFGRSRAMSRALMYKQVIGALTGTVASRVSRMRLLRGALRRALLLLSFTPSGLSFRGAHGWQWDQPPAAHSAREGTAPIQRTGPPAQTWALPQVLPMAA